MGDRSDRDYKGNSRWLPGDSTKPASAPFKVHLQSERTEELAAKATAINQTLGEMLVGAVYENDVKGERISLRTKDESKYKIYKTTLTKVGYAKKCGTINDPEGEGKIHILSVSPAVFLRMCNKSGKDPVTLSVLPPERLAELQALKGITGNAQEGGISAG